MKKIIVILICLIGVKHINAQNLELNSIQKTDSIIFWEFSFTKESGTNKKISTLILKRNRDVFSNDKSKKITPKIAFEIYPISDLDSISKIETKRLMMLSCCYPICGATIITTKNFVFWSNPWSITSAFYCNGIDYTRKNAELILDKVSKQNYNSIEELIADLTIEKIKD